MYTISRDRHPDRTIRCQREVVRLLTELVLNIFLCLNFLLKDKKKGIRDGINGERCSRPVIDSYQKLVNQLLIYFREIFL